MAHNFSRKQSHPNPDSTSRRKLAGLRQTSSATGATASHGVFLLAAHLDPARIAGTLSRVDRATQARVMKRLEQDRGNAYVQRVVAAVRNQAIHVAAALVQPSPLPDLDGQIQRKETKTENKPSEAVTLTFGENANVDAASDHSKKVLEDILRTAGLHSATITSTARTPTDQARAMYNNLETTGVAHQRALYGPFGDQVIDVYANLKKEKRTADEIKAAMTAKIEELGPSKVSNHCANPGIKNIIDIAPNSIADKKGFERAVAADDRISKFIKPPADPAYHIEIPQRSGMAGPQVAPLQVGKEAPEKPAFKKRKYELSKGLVKVIKGDAKQKTAVLQEAPADYANAILRKAKIDPAAWFSSFTDITFLGRKLDAPVHMELAAHLKAVEKKLAAEYGGAKQDSKTAGDVLGLSSAETIKGAREAPTSAAFSMHLFGLAVDLNYTSNPFISSAANPVFARAGLLVHGEKVGFRNNMSYAEIKALDATLEAYFSYISKPEDLQTKLVGATDTPWKGMGIKQALALIKADLNLVARKWQRSGATQKETIKQGGFMDLKQELVEGMELNWGAAYGDIMHFDMRNKGTGARIHKAIEAYKTEKKNEAKEKWKQEHT